jgi:uncharacterized membrane protein
MSPLQSLLDDEAKMSLILNDLDDEAIVHERKREVESVYIIVSH